MLSRKTSVAGAAALMLLMQGSVLLLRCQSQIPAPHQLRTASALMVHPRILLDYLPAFTLVHLPTRQCLFNE